VSPLSLPVLGGAAVVSSPALWRALVEGTTSTEVALTRYLVSVVICWAVLAFVAMLVGPAPQPEAESAASEEHAEAPAT
jgi:hypothetical protein